MPESEQPTEPEHLESDQGAPHPEDPEAAPVEFEQLPDLLKELGEKNVVRFDDVPLKVSIELGRVALPIRDILEWREGAIVETAKLSGQAMEIMVNGKLFGRGEVVVVGDNLAIRITELETPDLT